MTERMVQERDEELVDPIEEAPGYDKTESIVGLWGHPLHAMSVAFPVALTFCCFGADVLYWWSGEVFWARAALWAAGTAFLFGLAAGVTGTAELLLVPGIRARAPAWTHFVIAVLLLSLLGANWGYRLQGFEMAILPYGILLSGFNVLVVMVTGWHGGKLVFDYRLGTSKGS
ncbi:DUF2231 domain-containing protein [Wenxinia marina]|uniref:Putative membrane protein n=1 Tax=Wenxinia marina DSM 24838 TaxID=1123501 RepID=A0A0D0NIG7_9RHOB|nr:DUF2231 domain-containing protein [Wenxinia marina]KIQ68125.1 putative membrane protein [Wenxinia marina DSM 24838]GGL78471.1 hypothetical protein GCM10011392_36180 [Wenxinia marina]